MMITTTMGVGIFLVEVIVALLLDATIKRMNGFHVFLVAALLLPTLAILGGAALMAGFLYDAPTSGEGPAFFGILFIMILLPFNLLIPRIPAGLVALALRPEKPIE